MVESEIRSWLKKVWGKGLSWTEPARGGSVGLPDVTIPLLKFEGGDIPLELKRGIWKRKGLFVEVRPSQIRYHRLAAERGVLTAFLIVDNSDDGCVFLLPGWKPPQKKYVAWDVMMMPVCSMSAHHIVAKDRLIQCLSDVSPLWRKG